MSANKRRHAGLLRDFLAADGFGFWVFLPWML